MLVFAPLDIFFFEKLFIKWCPRWRTDYFFHSSSNYLTQRVLLKIVVFQSSVCKIPLNVIFLHFLSFLLVFVDTQTSELHDCAVLHEYRLLFKVIILNLLVCALSEYKFLQSRVVLICDQLNSSEC
jgi:hypothetical protein